MEQRLTGNVFLIRDTDTDAVLAALEQEGTAVRGNPDVYVRAHGQFGIDDAHELTARAIGRAMGERGRTFVIGASSMTTEAQNALLKTVEDPPGDARFFFVLPSPETLLATVQSRAQIIDLEGSQTSLASDDAVARNAAAFLAGEPAQRLDLLKPLLEKDHDEKRDLGTIITFLSSLEKALAAREGSHVEGQTFYKEGLEAVYRARRYVGDKGALLKPLLESVALLVPRM